MEFSKVLREIREESGYKTPRSFYLGQGGRKFFRCTYRQYANVEMGRSLPSPGLVEKIAVALRLGVDEERARDFVMAYLRSFLGNDTFLEFVVRTLNTHIIPSKARGTHIGRAVEQSFKARVSGLTKAQTDLFTGSREGYWCFAILSNDKGRWTAKELSGLTGLPAARLKKTLQKFVDSKLFSMDEDGRFYCSRAGKEFLLARDSFTPLRIDKLRGYLHDMAAKRGGEQVIRYQGLRASEKELRTFLPSLFEESYKNLGLFATTKKGPDTAIFNVETVLRKVLPF